MVERFKGTLEAKGKAETPPLDGKIMEMMEKLRDHAIATLPFSVDLDNGLSPLKPLTHRIYFLVDSREFVRAPVRSRKIGGHVHEHADFAKAEPLSNEEAIGHTRLLLRELSKYLPPEMRSDAGK